MPSPFDYVNPGNAPGAASYMAPNMAAQLYQMIGGLPDDYFKGTQQARTLNMQKPILGPDGQPATDYATILNAVLTRGGGETAEKLLPGLLGAQAGQNARNQAYGDDGGATQPAQQPQRPPNLTPPDQTPATLRSASQGQQPPQQGTGRTVRQIIGDDSMDAGTLENYAKAAGARAANGMMAADQPLTPNQEKKARLIISSNVKPTGGTAGALSTAENNDTTPPGAGADPRGQNPSGAGVPPVTPPQQTINQRFPSYPGGPPPQQPVNTPVASLQHAQQLEAMRDRALRAAGGFGVPKETADMLKAQAAEWGSQAKQEREQLGEKAKATDPDILAAKKTEEQNKEDTIRYGKQLASIQGSAGAANRQLEHIQLAEALYNDPKLYTGAGESLNLMYKKVVNALNPNNTDALPQEAFRKTMAASVLNQVEQLKDDTAAAGGGGRIFQAQIELMEKAANNPDNTLAANRLLTEINKRASLTAKKIASMANNYKGGHLDAGFAQMVDDYYSAHPMFKTEEMQDVRRIAPPVVKEPADLKRIGWKDGMPFKTPDGRVMTHMRAPGE